MCLLILGGTADGRRLADFFYQQGLSVIYSVAGLVRKPKLSCKVISGGFTQFGGLQVFIKKNGVTAIIDVTHPYAQIMSTTAVETAKACGIPCWRFHRPAWKAQRGDQWRCFRQWPNLAAKLVTYRRVLLTCGQLNQKEFALLRAYANQKQWLRTAVKPRIDLPISAQWIKAMGPFNVDDEIQLMQSREIDVLVSKNSGGDATSAKLQAARELAIPVFMLERPTLADADRIFYTRQQCQNYVLEKFGHVKEC